MALFMYLFSLGYQLKFWQAIFSIYFYIFQCLSSNTLSVNKDSLHFSSSNPNLAMLDDKPRPFSLGDYPESAQHHQRIEDIKLRETFISKAEQGNLRVLTLISVIFQCVLCNEWNFCLECIMLIVDDHDKIWVLVEWSIFLIDTMYEV